MAFLESHRHKSNTSTFYLPSYCAEQSSVWLARHHIRLGYRFNTGLLRICRTHAALKIRYASLSTTAYTLPPRTPQSITLPTQIHVVLTYRFPYLLQSYLPTQHERPVAPYQHRGQSSSASRTPKRTYPVRVYQPPACRHWEKALAGSCIHQPLFAPETSHNFPVRAGRSDETRRSGATDGATMQGQGFA